MDAGETDRAVTVQQLTEEAGTSHFPMETWTTLLPVYWLSKKPVSGRERFVADQLSAPFDTRWRGHYVASLDPELVDVPKTRRIVYQGRVHDIVDAQQIGMREGVELLTLATSKVPS